MLNNYQIRTCVVTRKKCSKKHLLRICSFRKNFIQIDPTGKLPGRGCYIYPSIKIYNYLIKNNFKNISKALKKELTLEEKEYLKNELLKYINNFKSYKGEIGLT